MSRTGRLALAAGALYLGTRLFGLTVLPMFMDETTHIRWAVEIASGEKWQRPWNYGKGLSIFANALLFPWALGDYLWWSRALTVAWGAVSLLAGMATARRLFDEAHAAVFAVLYVACPYALFYDRLALTDPPMAAVAALVLLSSIELSAHPRVALALKLAAAMVLAVLTKATGVLVGGIPLLAWLLLGRHSKRRTLAFSTAGVTAAAALAWPLHRFFATTATVRLGVGHRDQGLLGRFATNLPEASSWLATYLTLPVTLLVLAGLAFALRERNRGAVFLAGLVAGPIVAFSAVATLWFPRYLVLVIVPALLLAAHGASRLFARLPGVARALALVVFLLPALRFDHAVLTDPARAPLPEADRSQFVLGWPSGYGTDGVLAFVREELGHHPRGLTVVVHVHSRRTTWLALGLEFAREPRVALRDLDLARSANLDLLALWAHAQPTLLVLSPVGPSRSLPEAATWAHLGSLVLRSCKPEGGECDLVFRLDTPRSGAGPAGAAYQEGAAY